MVYIDRYKLAGATDVENIEFVCVAHSDDKMQVYFGIEYISISTELKVAGSAVVLNRPKIEKLRDALTKFLDNASA